MSTAKHSPGPWSVGPEFREVDGHTWLSFSYQTPVRHPNGLTDLALVDTAEEDGEANARLIAAAPDGLDFALGHDAYMRDAGYSGPDDAALHPKAAENWRKCLAFIAKTTGEVAQP